MENNLKPQIHICPICRKKSEWYSVYEINQQAPCSEKCRKEQNENNKRNKSI